METGSPRLKHKPFNDEVVRIALSIAGNHKKPGNFVIHEIIINILIFGFPVEFHTGLGDSDIIFIYTSSRLSNGGV